MGVKLFAFIRRAEGASRESFQRYWREEHGELIRRTPSIRRHVLRYEQNQRLASDYERDRDAFESSDGGFDGVAVLWFASLDGLAAFQAEPAYASEIAPDEERFMERSATAAVVTREPDVIWEADRGRTGAGAKLVCIFARHPGLAHADFHRHWLEHHGGLFQQHAELRAGMLAYDQNHGLDPASPSGPVGYDGVTEQWFDDLGAFVAGMSDPLHREIVDPDVAYMLDAPSIQFIVSGPPQVVIGD